MSIKLAKSEKGEKIKIKDWDKLQNWTKGFIFGGLIGAVLLIITVVDVIIKPTVVIKDFILPLMLFVLGAVFGALIGATYDERVKNPYKWVFAKWHFYLILIIFLGASFIAGENLEEKMFFAFTLFLGLLFVYLIIRGFLDKLRTEKEMMKKKVKELR